MRKLLRQCRVDMQQLFALRSSRGPYRFLVRNWNKISDIELATRVLGTEYFKAEVTPLPLPIEKLRSILVLAPHQDDEVIGAGGALLLASKAGVKIDVLYLTDGAQNKKTYAPNPADTVLVRNQEAAAACARLGAGVHHLAISNLKPEPTLADLDRLSAVFQDLEPEVVMAPWILDSPAKHRLVNHLLWLAHQRNGLTDCEVWGYQVHNTLYANGYVDITSVADEKRSLLECFRSQNEHVTRHDHMAMGMAAWNAHYLENSLEPRYAEVFFALPLDELLRLVNSCYLPNLEAVYQGKGDLLNGARKLQQAVMSNESRRRRNTQSKDRLRDDRGVAVATGKATIKA